VRWKGLKETEYHPHPGFGIAISGVVKGDPDQRDGVAVNDSSQDQQVEWGVAVLPGSAIETHKQLPRGKLHEEECQEDLRCELLITDCAFHTAFLGFRGTAPRQVRAKVSVIDTLCGDDREDKIDDPLKGVDAEEGNVSFVLSSEFVRLLEGGSWLCHNSRTPPLSVPVEGQLRHVCSNAFRTAKN